MPEYEAAAPPELSSDAETEQRFRDRAQAFGIEQRTIERMALSPSRALACVEEARRRGTGPGLAVHMFDAGDDPSQGRKVRGPNLYAESSCMECGGDRFVVVDTRAPVQSAWMTEHKITASADEIEVYAPCPACGAEV